MSFTHTHTCMRTHTHAHVHMHPHTHTHSLTQARSHAHTCASAQAHTHTHQHFVETSGCEFLLLTSDLKKFIPNKFFDPYFEALNDEEVNFKPIKAIKSNL